MASRRIHSRDPRVRPSGDGRYSMAHMLPWTDPASEWMASCRSLEVTTEGPGWRWGLKPRKRAA